MRHLKRYNESSVIEKGINIAIGRESFYCPDNTVILDIPPQCADVFTYQVLYFIAQQLEKAFDFTFESKKISNDHLTCTFNDGDIYKLSIGTTTSATDCDIVLLIRQSDGKYLRSHSIKPSAVGGVLMELEKWRQSNKLTSTNAKTGVFE